MTKAVLVAFGVGLLLAFGFTTVYGLFVFKEVPFSAGCFHGMCMGIVHYGSASGVLMAFAIGFVAEFARFLRRRPIAP